jgi:hypothetical protein
MPEPAPQVAAPPRIAAGSGRIWSPTKVKIKAWCLERTLNHYEVLDLAEDASEAEIQLRHELLSKRLDQFANSGSDGSLQELGHEGKKRLLDLKVDLKDRATYGNLIRREKHERSVEKIRKEARAAVEKDNVLEQDEWQYLCRIARDEEVSREELEEIILEIKQRGVLTGLSVADQEVRTFDQLKETLRGRAHHLVPVMWNGELERWLNLACQKAALAQQAATLKEEFGSQKLLGAQIWLWRAGEKRIILESASGPVEVTGLQQWLDAVEKGALADSSFKALNEGTLEGWFLEALDREEMAAFAANAKGHQDGLNNLVKQIKAALTGQTGSFRPFRFKDQLVYTLEELASRCDQFPSDAEVYLFEDIFAVWLAGTMGEADLAREARKIQKSHAKNRHKGLEIFVRELCNVAKIDGYPRVEAHPTSLVLLDIPQGMLVKKSLKIINTGRGYVWGTVKIGGNLPGLSHMKDFDGANSEIQIEIDTLHLSPGHYAGTIIVQGEGLPKPCIIPIEYDVLELSVSIEPYELDLGAIPHGKTRGLSVRVSAGPSGGRLLGTASFESERLGLTANGMLDGELCELNVSVDTSLLEAGRKYRTNLALNTNAGVFALPVQFQTQIRWDVVVLWTLGVAALVGLLMFLSRYALASAGYILASWVTSYGSEPSVELLLPCGIFALVVSGAIALWIKNIQSYRPTKKLRKEAGA